MKERKYDRLMEELKEQILQGAIGPGEKLPSENMLSGRYQVSRQTVRKALGILESEGLIYAEHGRGTFCSPIPRRRGSSKTIAVVLTYLSDYIFPQVIQGIESVLTSRGYSILLKATHNSRSAEARCLEELLRKEIDGVIIEPSKSQMFCHHENLYRKLTACGIPWVFIQGYFPQMEQSPRVLMDDCGGGRMITRYLLERGHRQLAGVFKADDVQGQNRHKGYVQALQEAGIAYDPDRVIWFHTEDRFTNSYESICRMVRSSMPMDGVVCYNDQIALRVIQALTDMGKKVPEQVWVTGYDNSLAAGSQGISLTTIAHPQQELGRLSAELLLKLIGGGERESDAILIPPALIEGDSCR